MHFYAIKTGSLGVLGGPLVLLDDPWDLRGLQRTRRRHLDKAIFGVGATFSLDRRRRYRRFAVGLQLDTGKTSHVPQLTDNFAARRVHCVGDLFPAGHLFLRPDSRSHGIATSLGRNVRRFGNDQAGTGTLSVVSGVHFIWHTVVGHPATCDGRHDYPVSQLQRPQMHGRKKVGIRGDIGHKASR